MKYHSHLRFFVYIYMYIYKLLSKIISVYSTVYLVFISCSFFIYLLFFISYLSGKVKTEMAEVIE